MYTDQALDPLTFGEDIRVLDAKLRTKLSFCSPTNISFCSPTNRSF